MRKYTLLSFLAVAAATLMWSGSEAEAASPHNWESFKAYHGKQYPSAVHEKKANAHFEANKARIAAHNKNFDAGLVSYKLALNQHADEDPQEFLKKRNGAKMPSHLSESIHRRKKHHHHRHHHHHHHPTASTTTTTVSPTTTPSNNTNTTGSFDWRNMNAVSAVENQGACGSCWAFSATGALESQVMKANNGQYTQLSEEQLVDCDTSDDGCGGGWPTNAFQFWQNNGGADSLADYPYTAGNSGQGSTCNNGVSGVQPVTGFQQLTVPTDDGTLQSYLEMNGPLSIGVNASAWDSQYSSGIISCDPNPQPDHAILLVGYGDDNGDYWIIKNSWGTDWGEQGFAMIAMGTDQDCGVTQFMAAYPTIS